MAREFGAIQVTSARSRKKQTATLPYKSFTRRRKTLSDTAYTRDNIFSRAKIADNIDQFDCRTNSSIALLEEFFRAFRG
jgi:hypothetical protein